MRLFKLTDDGLIEMTDGDDVLLPGDRFVLHEEEGDDEAAIQAVVRALTRPLARFIGARAR